MVLCFLAYTKALEDALAALDKIAMSIDVKDRMFLYLSMIHLFALFVLFTCFYTLSIGHFVFMLAKFLKFA